ncbi:hypothetical protein [Sulfurimonas sp. HSL3-7]|uniref:hypothetical protein n=1 Tax=Sulfonitrofixus jiaomeiensis TaxID=3131938 RepID=UPI0031F9F268
MSTKEELIKDIETLLNSYDGETPPTVINPALLAFMDEETLRNIIDSLLRQKENVNKDNLEWLEQFKKYD